MTANTHMGTWIGHPNPGFTNELQVAECNVIYLVSEFWPYSYERERPLLYATFQRHSLTGMRLRAQLRYNSSSLNIAIHTRAGDIRPTAFDLQLAILRNVLERLNPLGLLPVEVWVFSEAPEEFVVPLRAVGFTNTTYHYDTSNMPALLTFMHLLESDVTIGAESFFSWFAAFLSRERPLFFAAPSSRESALFQNYMAGNIRVNDEAEFNDSSRLASAAALWRSTRPDALEACKRSTLLHALTPSSLALARIQRLDYISAYKQHLDGLHNATGHIAPNSSVHCVNVLSPLVGDETAGLCGLEKLDSCTILSVSHASDFSWEKAIASTSGCHVDALDCSSTAESSLERVHVQPFCMNISMDSFRNKLRAFGLKHLTIFRIALEGHEHVVVDDLLRGFRSDATFSAMLPDQILLHARHTNLSWLSPDQQIPMETLGQLFLGLANMGYSPLAREDSSSCAHFSSFTYVRTAC